jgi:4-amino-4-deoxy-L-arabinose transferase-like glycosyltransferase
MAKGGFAIPSIAWRVSGIVAIALMLRLWGTNFGLPFAYHPDEGAIIMPAVNILRTGNYQPFRLDYGSAYIYALTFLYIPYFLYGAWRGFFTSVSDLPVFLDYHLIERYPVPMLFLIGRLLTAILGAMTVLLVYRLGNRLASKGAGLLAAVFLTVEPLHVRHSHFATMDVPMTCLVILALVKILDLFERGELHDYIWSGIWTGIAASTKFPGGMLYLSLVVAHLMRARCWSDLLDKHLAIGTAATAGGFLLSTPYALDLPYFLNWLAINLSFYGVKPSDALVEGPAWQYYTRILLQGETAPLVIFGVLGLAQLIKHDWRRGAIVMTFPIIYAFFVFIQSSRYARQLIPLIPFLMLGVGIFLDRVRQWLAQCLPSDNIEPHRLSALIVSTLAVLFAVLPLGVSAKISILLAGTDVRTTALEWYNANIAPQTKTAADWTGPPFLTGYHNVWRTWDLAERNADWYIEQGFEYLVISEPRVFDPNRTVRLEASYRELMTRFTLVKVFEGALLGIDGRRIWIYRVTP